MTETSKRLLAISEPGTVQAGQQTTLKILPELRPEPISSKCRRACRPLSGRNECFTAKGEERGWYHGLRFRPLRDGGVFYLEEWLGIYVHRQTRDTH